MEKETKEKGKHSGKKITQFPTQLDVQEELEDAAMDRFLRQSIIEDADRIERELNEDPKLIGIGASDDLFGKIVEELKTKGIWEDEKKTKVDEKPEPAKEEQQKPAIYDMLSDADREALAFGYQMQKKEQERKEKRKKRNRRLKHVSAAVVALVFVGGIGLSTEASRRWIFQVGDAIVENFGVSLKNNLIDSSDDIRFCSEEEETAIKKIQNSLKIAPVEFAYLPKEMKFISYDINKDSLTATISYMYNDLSFILSMCGNKEENVFYYQMDEMIQMTDTIVTDQGIEIQLYKSNNEKAQTYAATFEYNEDYYYLLSAVPYEETKKILKYLIIL